jgi:hypothetical protein
VAYADKRDQAAAARRHYLKNTEAMKARASARNAVTRIELQRYVREQKNKPCADCGGSYPHYVMDFDHVRGQKICEISNIANRRLSLRKLQDEIAKCDLVCANCHRVRTYGGSRVQIPPPLPTWLQQGEIYARV